MTKSQYLNLKNQINQEFDKKTKKFSSIFDKEIENAQKKLDKSISGCAQQIAIVLQNYDCELNLERKICWDPNFDDILTYGHPFVLQYLEAEYSIKNRMQVDIQRVEDSKAYAIGSFYEQKLKSEIFFNENVKQFEVERINKQLNLQNKFLEENMENFTEAEMLNFGYRYFE